MYFFSGELGLSNYPNPFNPTTTVAFDLPAATEVTLQIYDIQGRRINALLISARMQAGAHEISWNGRDSHDQPVASGIYFFELSSGSTRKITQGLLLK